MKPFDFALNAVKNNQPTDLRDILVKVPELKKEGISEFTQICVDAAKLGRLECLKVAHKYWCDWSVRVCTEAAKNGHLDCLRYAHKNGCQWSDDAPSAAAENGHLDCLKYLYKHRCRPENYALLRAIKGGHMNCVKYLYEVVGLEFYKGYIVDVAFFDRSFMEYFLEKNALDVEWVCRSFARAGRLDDVRYFHEKGLPLTYVCEASVDKGHLNCLKYAHENGCELTSDLYNDIIRSVSHLKDVRFNSKLGRYMDCLMYAYENGCPASRYTYDIDVCIPWVKNRIIAVLIFRGMLPMSSDSDNNLMKMIANKNGYDNMIGEVRSDDEEFEDEF
jgi:hypothetical protein